MDGLMKGIVKTGLIFSVVLVAAVAVFYVLPALADATVTSTVNPASVNTRQNVTLNFTITASGNSSLANITINVTGAGWLGLIAGNIVCPNATDAGQGTPWNASVAGNGQLATCFRNHTTQNLTGTISMAIKGLYANVTGQTGNFTINVTDDIDRTNITTVSVNVLLLEANATLDVAGVNAGAKQNYTFTIRNNGTDPIDRINITYDANFADPVAGDIVCPTTNALWNRSVASDIITCTRADPPNDDPVSAGGSATIKVENWSAPADARVKTFDFNVRGLKGGNFTVVAAKPSVAVFGNMTITGINRASNVNQTGTKNITVMKFDFNSTGEQMNVTQIIITRNGTVTDADIIEIKLYNSTDPEAGDSYNDTTTYDIIAVNASAPSNGRYTFSDLTLKVNTSQRVLLVVNLSSSAAGGKTFNFSIEDAADATTTGGHSGQSITETLATTRSSSTTIFGTLVVAGTNRVATTTQIGTTNVTVMTFNLTATGEQMNISEIIITRNGTSITDADIVEVTLFNTTDPAATAVNSTQTPLAVNTSAPSANGRYNFSGLSLKVPTGATGQILLVSFNISSSATGGRAFNASIEGAADIVTNASVSGSAIAETLSGQRSSSSTIYGTLAVTGGSRVSSSTEIGSTNVTIISFNFTTVGEAVNITGLNITFNGTYATSDIVRVALFNSSAANAGVYNETTYDLIQWNISQPNVSVGVTTLRYNFSNIAFNISAGTTNVLVVVVNLSEAARGGRTFNTSIEGVADVISTGVSSGVSLTETLSAQRSSTSMIKGNLSVTGTNIAPSAVDVGQIGVGILRITLNATGENINVTSVNITSNNTRNQDILDVRLFDDLGGTSTGTYDRNLDSPLAGASGVFGGSSGGSVLLTPTAAINVSINSLHYVYVVFDINTSATVDADRLGASIQAAAAISAVGNESNVTLTPQLLTGDPGAVNVDIRNLTATSTVITTGTAVARLGVGTVDNFTFTINNTATGSLKDSIDEIRILFGGTGFTLSGNATCPTVSTVAWNRTVLGANIIVCNVTDSGGRLAVDTNTTISVQNFTAGATSGIYSMNISVRGASGGVFNVTSNPAITAYGNLTVVGTDRVNATTQIGTSRITLLSMNFSATGEAANVTEILVTLNGTSLDSADITAVELYNSTDKSTTLVNDSQTLMRTNVTAAAPSLTYNFSGLNLSVPTGVTGQVVLVVVNISSSATGGRTINASVNGNGNMVTVTALTGINIAENFTLVNSSSTTIFGNLSVTGTSRVASTTRIGATNVTVISFNFTTTGEQMNITGINVTINGTGLTTADIVRVGLYNSSAAAAGVLDGSGVNYDLIQWNISEPNLSVGVGTMRFNFSNIGFNVSGGTTNVLLVVVNMSSSATGGRTFNASIEGAADVVTTSGVSGQAITETFASQRSSTSTIYGNLTISGTSRVASQTRLGSSNVTIISFNLTAFSEQMNVSEIIITRNGTIGNEDIVSVALYNSTKDNAATFNETGNVDPLAVNTSAPTNGRYNFSGLALKVPTGNIGQIIMVVFNVSGTANAGRTLNASIEGAADVVTTGGNSSAAITEDFASQRSSTSTIVGMKITGTSRVSSTTEIGATNVSVISFTFNASGEDMNVTGLNITINGTVTNADVVRVALYNSTAANAGVFNETTYDLISWNISEPNVSVGVNTLRYNFSNIAFNVTDGTVNTLVVVINVSSTATGGRTFNASIEGDGDAIVTGVSSGLAITETYTTQRSSTSTILGSLSVTGTNRVASYTRLGSINVTMMTFNFTTTGEQMNISEIIITRNGTATNADVVEVRLYNTSDPTATALNETQTAFAVNTSAPTNGRYNFSGLNLKVQTGATGQIVLVVFNVSSTATGNTTFNASIEDASDIVSVGSVSNTSIAETLATQRSSTSTIISFNVSSVSLSPNNISANQTIAPMLNIIITALGESMNVTSFNFTLTGNATTGNITDVRLYRDDAAPLGQFTDADTYLSSRGTFNGNSLQINLSATNYNLSVSQGTTTFFVTYNVSGGARAWATAGVQLIPSGVAALGNVSALAISVTGSSVASANSTIQSEAALSFGSITSIYPWITNKTSLVNITNISIPVTNDGTSIANLTSVLLTFLSEANANNASSNFTVVRSDSQTSITGGVTTTLNFTVNATTGAQLVGQVNASVRLLYNDSNTYATASLSNLETNTTGLFGVDGIVPTISIVNPVLGGNASGNQVDINFTLNDTGSGINRSAIVISINSVARNATCNGSGLNFTCNYSMFSSDSLFVFGSITARIVNVTDNATNSASAAEINFTLNNNDGVTANYTYPNPAQNPGGTLGTKWVELVIPDQFILEERGINATNTGDFNVTAMTRNLGTSWTHIYYKVNETSYVLATRTDFAGSALKYLNNTGNGDRPYWINMTASGMVFKI